MRAPGLGPVRGELQQTEHVMISQYPNSQYPNSVKINRVHSAAICSEIGERLGDALIEPSTRLPPRLTELLNVIERNEVELEESRRE